MTIITTTTTLTQSPEVIKTCCAMLYESYWARLLLDETFHPGGLELTRHLGELMDLQPGMRVLDVASGKGESALFLAQQFGCDVVGVDYSTQLIDEAKQQAATLGLSDRVQFQHGDADALSFDDASFDAVLCECAFCVFTDKTKVADEFARVLKPGGRLGLSDLTRDGALPPELDDLLAWIACIADAQPLERYVTYLRQASLSVTVTEQHDSALTNLIKNVRAKLFGAQLLAGITRIELPEGKLLEANRLIRAAADAADAGRLGYAIIVATR